jgi:hypothetical protein
MSQETTLRELLARPPDNKLVLRFSTAAPDWKYERTPEFCKKFPISLMFNKNWGSGLIRRSCHSPFSHVDIVLKDGTLLGASDSPNAPYIHGNPRGVATRPMDYQQFAYRRQMVIETERADDIRRIAVSQLGKSFDRTAIRDFINDSFPGYRDWRLNDSWFCAELIMWAMESGYMWGSPPIPWPKNRVSPTDILMMFVTDKRWLNRDTFWLPIPSLVLGPGER